MEASHRQGKLVLFAGLAGLLAGLLLAPDKGSATRQKLKAKAEDFSDKAKDQKEQAKSKLRSFKQKKDAKEDELMDSVDAAADSLERNL